jgi:tRNA(Ile)-lysidine synthase
MNIDTNSLKKYSELYLGFSGGADSTALAHSLKSAQINFKAVHFHHHLRQTTADKDAEFCENFCKNHTVPFLKVDLYVNKEKYANESIEAAARRLRQEWWEANTSKDSAVLLAHHRDDLRENFILRAMRGSSSTGLTGFKAQVHIQGVLYLRPLFTKTRNDILQYLSQNGISWREDDSNDNLQFTRNRVRKKIMPQLAKMASLEGLDRTLSNTSLDADFLEQAAQTWLENHSFNCQNFLECHDALKPRILRYFYLRECKDYYSPGHDAIQRLTQECEKVHKETISVTLTSDIQLQISTNGQIYIPPKKFDTEWDWQKQPKINIGPYELTAKIENYHQNTQGEVFSIKSLAPNLQIRNWLNGDSMIPFGKQSPQKIKKLFSNKKLSPQERLQVPLILNEDKIIYIPSVKRAQFAEASLGEKVLVINYERL